MKVALLGATGFVGSGLRGGDDRRIGSIGACAAALHCRVSTTESVHIENVVLGGGEAGNYIAWDFRGRPEPARAAPARSDTGRTCLDITNARGIVLTSMRIRIRWIAANWFRPPSQAATARPAVLAAANS